MSTPSEALDEIAALRRDRDILAATYVTNLAREQARGDAAEAALTKAREEQREADALGLEGPHRHGAGNCNDRARANREAGERLGATFLEVACGNCNRADTIRATPLTATPLADALAAMTAQANSAIGNALEAHGEIASLRADLATAANVTAALATEREGLQLLLLDEETAHLATMQERDDLKRSDPSHQWHAERGARIKAEADRDEARTQVGNLAARLQAVQLATGQSEFDARTEASFVADIRVERDAARADALRLREVGAFKSISEMAELLRQRDACVADLAAARADAARKGEAIHAARDRHTYWADTVNAALSDTSALEWLAAEKRKVAERVREESFTATAYCSGACWTHIKAIDLDALLKGEKP